MEALLFYSGLALLPGGELRFVLFSFIIRKDMPWLVLLIIKGANKIRCVITASLRENARNELMRKGEVNSKFNVRRRTHSMHQTLNIKL